MRENALHFELQSRRDAPVWIELEAASLENLSANPPLPWTFRLESGETRAAGTLVLQDPALPYAQRLRWIVLSGDPDARPDDRARYCMPFGGAKPVRISQGYEGEATHQGLGAYALDFPMPIGTPVLAARGGRIVASPDDGAEGETNAEGDAREIDQHVVIEHDDGTFAMYAHLRRGDAARPGQRVACGERIGYSGDTGRATGPHLHFDVYRIRRDGQRQTIPVRFWDGTAEGFEPRVDRTYAPGCSPPRPSACDGR
ncbi:MAG: M23 family metallopeptidase [Myxococcota bacterium]